MSANGPYRLPELSFGYGDLTPHLSEEQVRIHHQKHHRGYVDGANGILAAWEAARKEGRPIDAKATLKALAFNLAGHRLHTLFWENLAPEGRGGGGAPTGVLAERIERDFGSIERFREEFTAAAATTEGSGWGALFYDPESDRLLLGQIEKHQVNLYPGLAVLLVCDVWEHAYYVDYRNDRGGFLEAFWNVVRWDAVAARLERALR
jgi:Fe-Mn family superoxide dismutase